MIGFMNLLILDDYKLFGTMLLMASTTTLKMSDVKRSFCRF